LSQNQPPSQTFEQIIQTHKNNYIAFRSSQAAQEYDKIIAPYINFIIQQDKQIKDLESKLPKKEHNKGKK